MLSNHCKLLSFVCIVSSLSCSKGSDNKPIQVVQGNTSVESIKDIHKGSEIIQKVADAVVKLPNGTGFFLNHKETEYLITNDHVFGPRTTSADFECKCLKFCMRQPVFGSFQIFSWLLLHRLAWNSK